MRPLLRHIVDGLQERSLTAPEAVRSALRWLIAVASLHLLVGLPAMLGEEALFVAGCLTAAVQPLSAALIFMAGLQLHRGLRPHGALLMGLASVYLFCGLMPLVTGFEGLIISFFVAACMGPLLAVALFGVMAGAIARLTPADTPTPWRAWAVGLCSPVALALAGAVGTSVAWGKPNILVLWVVVPQLATALAVFLLWQHMRPSPGELDLADALMRSDLQGFELLDHTHPLQVQRVLSLSSHAPFRRAQSEGVHLGNPVLDGLLMLEADDPRALAKRLSGHEATVLAVLHAWPKAELLDDSLHWEASLGELQDKGPDLVRTLTQVQRDLRTLRALLDESAVVP